MQQGSGFGSGTGPAFGSSSGFGSNASTSSSAFGTFVRPQTPTQPSSSSAPPNTFSTSTTQNASFFSGSNNGQQPSSFGRLRPFQGRPRPPSQPSQFNAQRPSSFGEQSQPQSHQSQEQQPSTFGNRPRPFTSRSNGSGGPQDGRPPNSGSFRGGRGGGNGRPIRPSATHNNVNQQSTAMEGALLGSAHASRPRLRPFANKSTTFNTQPTTTASTAPAPSNAPASTPSSAFGASISAQTGNSAFAAFGTSSTSNSTGSSFPSQHTGSFAPNASAFGSSIANDKPAATATFGSTSIPSSAPAISSSPASAFGTSANTTSSSAFGGSSNGPSFGSTFSSAQPQTRSAAPAAQMSSNPSATATAATAAPTSSFSNFLRKDRTGTSTPTDASDAAKASEDEDELRKKRFEDAPKQGNRFLDLKGGREALRNAYIKSGVLPDPDKPTDLALAVKLVGTCQDMCPEFEREEREFQKELDPLEVYPGTDRVDPRIAVKIYRRPAAGRELPLPEDVRPPPVLKRTLDYLFHDLLPTDPNDPRFTSVQGFLWNRTRAVRQDFIVQSEGGAIAIECHERIARYHILCLHWRGGPGAEGWSEQQELEQLRKTMRSLIEFYDDNRRKASAGSSASAGQQASPNEAEFRAYNLLLHLRDPETLREAELLPGDIFRSPMVQTAINLRQLAQRSNNLEKRGQPRNTEATLNFFSRFFAELRKPNVNYLMACLAENSFSSIRIGALKAMSKAYMAQHRALPVERIQHVLGMDSADQVEAMATHLGIELEYESDVLVGVKIHRNATINEDKPLVTPFSTTIVETKRGSYTSADVVDGRASGASAPLPSTSSSVGQPAATAPFTQSFAKSTPAGKPSSFGFGTQPNPSASFGTSASSAFSQQEVQQDTSKPPAFGSTPPSKLSASAATFTPNAFGGSAQGNASLPTSFNDFGGFSTSGEAERQGHSTAKPALPSFGAFGKAEAKQEASANTSSPFGKKAAVPTSQTWDAQKVSSLPSFSFGGAATKSPFATSSSDSRPQSQQKSSTASGSSFTFGAAPEPEAQQSKPSMPSFFPSSPAAKEPSADKVDSNHPPSAAENSADAKQDRPAQAPTNQKRRASDATEKATLQAAAVKADAEAKAQAQAKCKQAAREDAVKRAFTALSAEVVRSAAAKTAASAVQAEDERRRAASRNELVTRLTNRLWEELADEQAAEVAEEISRIAAADVFRSRSCAMRAWTRWTQALEERRDREQQRQRLESIRSEIRRRNILGRVEANDAEVAARTPDSKAISKCSQGQTSPIQHAFSIRQSLLTGERTTVANDRSTTAARLKRKLGDEATRSPKGATLFVDDDALTDRWKRVRRQRDQLWAEETLLHKVLDHIEELLLHFRPADPLDELALLYSGSPGHHVASSWLRVKFGLKPSAPSGEDEGQIDRVPSIIELADGSFLWLTDMTPSSDGADVTPESVLLDNGHCHPCLVVFETSPAVAQGKTADQRRKALASDRTRLEKISSSKSLQESRLACRLLVVTWGDLNTNGDDDVEMSDADLATTGKAQSQDLLKSLGLDQSGSGQSLQSKVFDRVGILQLDDAAVSVEGMLSALLQRTMPDLTANPNMYLNGPRRFTFEDVVQDFCDQWGRLSALLFDLLNGLPAPSSSGPGIVGSKTDKLACKALQILTALANHILRTVVSLSETILEDDNPEEERKIELPLSSSETAGLVDMALSQVDGLSEDAEEQKLHLRSQLLSSLRAKASTTAELQHVLTVINRQFIEELFRFSLSKLSEVWIGVRQGTEADWKEAKEGLGRLCSAAAEEIAAETRTILAEYRASNSGSIDTEKEDVSPSKRIRIQSDASQESALPASEPAKASKVNDLRDLIARTKRFLDSPAS